MGESLTRSDKPKLARLNTRHGAGRARGVAELSFLILLVGIMVAIWGYAITNRLEKLNETLKELIETEKKMRRGRR